MFAWFKKFFNTPKTYMLGKADYWETKDGGLTAWGCWFNGWDWPNPKVGDIVAIRTKPGYRATYRVTGAKTPMDPGDQHFLDLEYIRQ